LAAIEALEITAPPPRSVKAQKKRKAPKRSKQAPAGARDAGRRNSDKLFEPLREWRLKQAKRKNIPAFRILTDKALMAICEQHPKSVSELLEISSVTRKSAAQYGDDIIRIIRNI
jgi:DNA topoisomerase-3